eukprot:COSAG02_NODE_21875_length_772_cov_0.476969_2_plen_89_part_00
MGGAFDASALEAGVDRVFNVADLERRASAGLLPTGDARAGVFDVAELERRDSGSGFSGGGAATVTAVRAGAFDVSALESGAVADALPV